MEKEFNLSEYIFNSRILDERVKEFIKRLKEETDLWTANEGDSKSFKFRIDKLAGDKLKC